MGFVFNPSAAGCCPKPVIINSGSAGPVNVTVKDLESINIRLGELLAAMSEMQATNVDVDMSDVINMIERKQDEVKLAIQDGFASLSVIVGIMNDVKVGINALPDVLREELGEVVTAINNQVQYIDDIETYLLQGNLNQEAILAVLNDLKLTYEGDTYQYQNEFCLQVKEDLTNGLVVTVPSGSTSLTSAIEACGIFCDENGNPIEVGDYTVAEDITIGNETRTVIKRYNPRNMFYAYEKESVGKRLRKKGKQVLTYPPMEGATLTMDVCYDKFLPAGEDDTKTWISVPASEDTPPVENEAPPVDQEAPPTEEEAPPEA